MTFIREAAKWYASEPHQDQAWDDLWASLDESTKETFKKAYRGSEGLKKTNPLKVRYQYQNDNASGTGYRECYSSSCAMLAAYHGKVGSDDEYNHIRACFGDTTNTSAQIAALQSLGLNAQFYTNGTTEDLKREIDEGRPVAVGWLHLGPVTAPRGGGHWSVIIGYTDKGFIVHDPNGEASLVNGGYVNYHGGESVHYSYKNWVPRWAVEGQGTGWYLTCKANGGST